MASIHHQTELTFKESVKNGFRNYASFKGRASRPEYWWWWFFSIVVLAAAIIIDALVISAIIAGLSEAQNQGANLSGDVVVGAMVAPYILTMIAALLLILPTLTVAVRRLHDINRSGYWIFLALIPIVGPLLLLYWHLLPSSQTVEPRYE